MDKYEYNTENYNRVDGDQICSEEITEVLSKMTGVDETEQLENAIYDLYVTGQNSHNRDSFRLFYKTLAIMTDKFQEDEQYRMELANRIETIFGNSHYSADEIEKDILIDPCYVMGRLVDLLEQKEE